MNIEVISTQDTQSLINLKLLKDKNTVERSLELAKKFMKSACRRLVTKDIK